MDKEKYILMNSEELYNHLISDVMADCKKGKLLVDSLTQTERYHADYEFRTFVETSRALAFGLSGEYTQNISLCTELIERTTALELWSLLALNQNLLGNAYFVIGIFERALEYYHGVIKTENRHGLFAMSSIAYNNIALLYLHLEAYDKTYEYFQRAIEALDLNESNQPRYSSKLLSYLSAPVPALCIMNQLDKILPIWKRIEKINLDEVAPDSLYSYYLAKMFYQFHLHNYDEGKAIYHYAKTCIADTDTIRYMCLLNDYIDLCEKFKLDYDFYKDELIAAESMQDSGRSLADVRIHIALRKYYQFLGEKESFERSTRKYIELLEKNAEDVRLRQLESLQVVEALIQDSENLADMTSKNTELQLIAEEAVRHKNALQEAYHRIEMINELGRKLTSSLNLAEVIDLIYLNLKENVPLKNFILMAAEPQLNQLRSVVYYDEDKLYPEFCIPLDHPGSIFAECYRRNRLILSKDIEQDPYFQNHQPLSLGDQRDSESLVFMPLNVGNQLIGVCSIQDEGFDIYTDKHIAFLEDLLPYLSIALNNAIRSQTLEREIQSHLQTQEELKKANQQLDRLSSLDGLTQISNRRDFEKRMFSLLQEAQRKKESVSLMMFDIDNFKLYNDTYGHLEGDEALKKVARVVHKHLDQVGGLSARFGGEEFIAACIGQDTLTSRKLAEQIRQEVYDLGLENRDAPLGRLSLSIGIALSKTPDFSQKLALMRWADSSLYRAKNSGKNKVILKEFSIEDAIPEIL